MSSRLPEKIVIHQPWGGLGDNLQFSTLPELFAAHGIPSFVSTRNVIRNPQIHQLVWGRNPFITGHSDEEPNAGAGAPYGALPRRLPFLQRIEIAHGLEPRSHYPKIYYQPNKKPKLENAVLLDLSSTSVLHRRSQLRKYVDAVVSSHQYDPVEIFQVRLDRGVAPQYHIYGFDDFASLTPKDIFDYCDALASCKAFITVHSGAQSLAVAVRGEASTPAIHCFCTPVQFNSRDYIFPRVDYYIAEKTFARRKLVTGILKRMPRALRAYIDSRS